MFGNHWFEIRYAKPVGKEAKKIFSTYIKKKLRDFEDKKHNVNLELKE